MADLDCERARKFLDNVRRNRRSQSPRDLAAAARALGYDIDASRGKGSHWFAKNGPGPHFPIPTGKDPVSVGTTTRILRCLEEAYDRAC